MQTQKISAVILAGGLGTRLRPVLGDLPKVLAPVGGRPFITYILDQLMEAGFDQTLLCLGFQAELIQEALGGQYKDLKLEYSIEPEVLGTGGAVRYALPKIEQEEVLILNGDSYVEGALCEFDKEGNRDAEGIGAVKVADSSRYGSLEWDESGRVVRFAEKKEEPLSGWINAGIYRLKRKTIERISSFQNVSLERNIFPPLVRERCLHAFPLTGNFLDIGTPESLAQAEEFFVIRDRFR